MQNGYTNQNGYDYNNCCGDTSSCSGPCPADYAGFNGFNGYNNGWNAPAYAGFNGYSNGWNAPTYAGFNGYGNGWNAPTYAGFNGYNNGWNAPAYAGFNGYNNGYNNGWNPTATTTTWNGFANVPAPETTVPGGNPTQNFGPQSWTGCYNTEAA